MLLEGESVDTECPRPELVGLVVNPWAVTHRRPRQTTFAAGPAGFGWESHRGHNLWHTLESKIPDLKVGAVA